MKAYLISPDSRSIEPTEVEGMDDIVALVGYETIESDAIGSQGDRLYFDEECFIRGTAGRFQIDKVIPVAGKGVIVGVADDGVTLQDVSSDLEELRTRIKYL
jgi:hypothetical protein